MSISRAQGRSDARAGARSAASSGGSGGDRSAAGGFPGSRGPWRPGRFDPSRLIDTLSHDVSFALRQVARRPGFSALVALTLAVGIGANTAIFSVLKGVVLRDLPYPEPERLVAVWETPPDSRSYYVFSSADYFDVREQSQTFEEFGVLFPRWFNLAGEEAPVRVRGAGCTASLLRLLGVPPLYGRLFTDDEEVEGKHRVLVLSYGLWKRQFGGEPGVIGRGISVNGLPYEIIGIMPEKFEFPTLWGGRDDSQLWAPLVQSRNNRGSHWLGAIARLEEGVTATEAETELQDIAARLSEAYPNTNAQTDMWIEPMMQRTLGGIREALVFLLIVVGLVLLIACANVASMLLARGTQRLPEFAIRASMGAGRSRLARQLLTESLVLSLIGGATGFLLAYWGVDALRAILPDNVPRVTGIQVDTQVLGFAAMTTIVAGLLFGLAPALFASRIVLVNVLKEGRLGRGGIPWRLSGTIVAAQVAIGLILVNATALLVVSYFNVISQDLNFDTDEVLVAGISLSGPAYREPHRRRVFYDELLERVRGLPGVVQAGVTNKLPLMGGINASVLVDDDVYDPQIRRDLVEYSFVDDGYHEAMGIGLLSGRTLNRRDLDRSSVAAGLRVSPVELPLVINRTMAEQMWPGEDPIGKLVRPNTATEYFRARVVGIVEDVMQWGAEKEPFPEVYFPYTAGIWGWGGLPSQLVVRAAGDPSSLVLPIREVVRAIDDQIPVAEPSTMSEILHSRTGQRRFSMLLASLFAATALILIVAGTYGVMSYVVSQRTREIGVRVALGADNALVLWHFLAQAGRLFLPGLVIGLLGALAASTLTRSMVYGVSALSSLCMAVSVAVMIAVAFAASTVPVLRATRVDPMQALRTE